MRFATLHLAWRLTFAISLLLVTVGSLLPTQQLPDLAFDIWDKAQHAAGFGWLMFCGLMSHGWRDGGWRLAVALGAWGAVIELLQAWSGWRHGRWPRARTALTATALPGCCSSWRGRRSPRRKRSGCRRFSGSLSTRTSL